MPSYRNRSTGQVVDADGPRGDRLERLTDRWERLEGDGASSSTGATGSSNRAEVRHPAPGNTGTVSPEIGSADVDVEHDDATAHPRNADVAGPLDTGVPSAPPAAPAGDLPDVGDREGAVAGVTNVAASSSDTASSSTSTSSDTEADPDDDTPPASSRKRTSGKRRSS